MCGTTRYDGIGELTRAVFTSNNPAAIPNQDLQYVYDAAGNRIRTIINGVTTDYVTNDLNEYTQIGTASLSYDLDGNLVSRTDGGGTTTYAYDALNRLKGVTAPCSISFFEYDAFDNLSATTDNGQHTDYLIDPFGLGDIVAEYSASSSLIAHYTYGLGLTSRTDSSGAAAYYDFDAIGSTAGLYRIQLARYADRYSYLPFGEALPIVGDGRQPFHVRRRVRRHGRGKWPGFHAGAVLFRPVEGASQPGPHRSGGRASQLLRLCRPESGESCRSGGAVYSDFWTSSVSRVDS